MKKKDMIINFTIGCIIGIIGFILLFGVKVIDVTYVDWLKDSADLTQHYIGWEFFRNDVWRFPIGTFNNLAYPLGTSSTYMDSIPIFSFIFKAINTILPEQFQYFGLWGIISFALSGGISSIILSKFMQNRIVIFTSSIFFIFAPVAIFRMFMHTALAAHWIILLAIMVWVYKDKFKLLKINILIWTGITSLSVLIHPYFTVIVFIILLGYCIQDFMEHKRIKESVLIISVSVIITGIIFYAIGGLNTQSTPSDGGLGYYSMNMNSSFNPQGWSKLINDLPNATDGQYEGFQYLGMGIILMIPISIILLIKKIFNNKNMIKDNIKFIVPISIVFILSLIVSLSPTITANSKTIAHLQFPDIIIRLWSIFRSSGRLFWGMTYIIMFVLIVIICKNIKSDKFKVILISSLVLVQLYDISGVLYSKHNEFTTIKKYDSPLKSEIWNDLSDKFEHIVFLPASSTYDYDHFSYYAVKNNMTLNTGYIAHGKFDVLDNLYNADIEKIKNNEVDETKIYIIKAKEIIEEVLPIANSNMAIVNIDGYDVIFNNSSKGINLDAYKDVHNYIKDGKLEN